MGHIHPPDIHAYPPTHHHHPQDFQGAATSHPPYQQQPYGVPHYHNGADVHRHGGGGGGGDVILQNPPFWSSGLCNCMEDPYNALLTLCVPCATFGQIAEIVDMGGTSCAASAMLYGVIACCFACPCVLSCFYRKRLRNMFGIAESCAPDCVIHCFCEPCALCQEYRELKYRGLDPSAGWNGNMARMQQPQPAFMPPSNQSMM